VGFPRPAGVPAPVTGTPPAGVRTLRAAVPPADPATGGRRTTRAGLRARRAGRPRLLLPLAATVALLAAGGVVGADELGLAPAPVVVPRTGASDTAPGPASGPASEPASGGRPADGVRRGEAVDPRTGVAAEVELAPGPPGTPGSRVSVSLTGLTGPRSCRLVAVRADGATQVLATWQVPASGFGTSRQPDPFTLAVDTAGPVADLGWLRVESVDPAGGSTTLVRVRL
jgi:hypothetical protein